MTDAQSRQVNARGLLRAIHPHWKAAPLLRIHALPVGQSAVRPKDQDLAAMLIGMILHEEAPIQRVSEQLTRDRIDPCFRYDTFAWAIPSSLTLPRASARGFF
jgi:hypothetical protein